MSENINNYDNLVTWEICNIYSDDITEPVYGGMCTKDELPNVIEELIGDEDLSDYDEDVEIFSQMANECEGYHEWAIDVISYDMPHSKSFKITPVDEEIKTMEERIKDAEKELANFKAEIERYIDKHA